MVGQLPAHLRVERRAVQDHLDVGARLRHGGVVAVHQQRDHRGVAAGLGVPQELRSPAQALLDLLEDADVGVARLLRARVRPCALLLLLHERAEAVLVDLHALLRGHLQCQVDGEAVGVVQGERRSARDRGSCAPRLGHRRVQDRGPRAQGAAERVLLRVGDLGDGPPIGLELRVRGAHRVLRGRQQHRHRRVVDAEQAHGAHGPADQAAQHVAASVVAWPHAVPYQHQGGAHVVGHDAQAHVVGVGLARLGPRGAQAVGLPAHRLRCGDHGEDLVDLVHVRLVLHDEGQALQAGPRVDRGPVELADQFEVVPGPLAADELVEDQVPDLQEAVAPRVDHGPPAGAVLRSAVVMDLAARAGRPGLPRRPGDLGEGEALDALGGQADLAGPVVEGDLVLFPDRHPQAVAVEPVAALVAGVGEQVPREVDRALFEVVAEGEVAVHLEERAVARRLAHVVDVVRPHALLHGGRPGPRRRLRSEDVGDEGDHSRDREQNGGLGRDQGD